MGVNAVARLGGLALSLIFGLLICAPSAAEAQPTPNFDSQRYLPAGNYHGFLVVPEAQVLPKLKFGFDVQLDFAYRPLQKLTSSQSREAGVIDALFAGHGRFGFAPTDWIQVDVIMAFMQFARSGDGLGDIGGNIDQVFSLGDLWVQGRFRLLKEEKHFVSVALMPFVTFPTGNPNLLLTSGVPTFGANAMISRMIWRFRLAGSIGYRLKLGNPGYKLLGQRVAADDELMYSAGIGFQVVPEKLDLNLELFGTGIVGPGRSPNVIGDYAGKGIVHSPLEALFNARIHIKRGCAVVAGVGWGITTGIGTPAFRVIAGVSYAPNKDRDGDGMDEVLCAEGVYDTLSAQEAGQVRVIQPESPPSLVQVQGVHCTLAGDVLLKGSGLSTTSQVLVDGVPVAFQKASPVELLVPVTPEVPGGFRDVTVLTDQATIEFPGGIGRYPAVGMPDEVGLGAPLTVRFDNGEPGSYVLAFSGMSYDQPAPFEAWGWFHGLELNGVWIFGGGILSPGDTERLHAVTGPSDPFFLGHPFHVQAWAWQADLGLVGFSNMATTTVVP